MFTPICLHLRMGIVFSVDYHRHHTMTRKIEKEIDGLRNLTKLSPPTSHYIIDSDRTTHHASRTRMVLPFAPASAVGWQGPEKPNRAISAAYPRQGAMFLVHCGSTAIHLDHAEVTLLRERLTLFRPRRRLTDFSKPVPLAVVPLDSGWRSISRVQNAPDS